MSCIKYCRKQIAKKRATAPPPPSTVPNDRRTSLRRPKEGNQISPPRRETYPSATGSIKSHKASRNKNKTLLGSHRGGLSVEVESPSIIVGRGRVQQQTSISVPDLTSSQGPMPESILKKTSQYCSFESFKSVSSVGGGWITPDQDSTPCRQDR